MKIELPLTYEDITINQVRKDQGRDMSDFERVLIYSEMKERELRAFPIQALTKASHHILNVLNTPTKIHKKTFEYRGVKYGFIPDWTNFTTGEWVDMEEYLKDPIENAHKVMSILYRPIKRELGDKYEIEDYKGTHDLFNDLPYCWFEGCLLFFWTTRKEHLTTSLLSLAKAVEGKPLQANGGGIIRSHRWLTTTLRKLKGLLANLSHKF